MAEADVVQAGLGHRKVVAHDAELGARLAPAFDRAGWNVFRVLIMLRRRPPERSAEPGAGAEVGHELGAATLAAFRREQPFGWQEEAVRQLAEMDRRYDEVLAARDFGSPPEDPGCACRLYMHDGLGQVDEVGHAQGAATPRSRARGGCRRGRCRRRAGLRRRCSWSPTPPTGRRSSTGASASTRSASRTSS